MKKNMVLPLTYQSLLALSERMVGFAREQDWDALVAMEEERGALMNTLPAQLPALPAEQAKSIALAIERILECNTIIHEHVAPWREQVSILLAAFSPKE